MFHPQLDIVLFHLHFICLRALAALLFVSAVDLLHRVQHCLGISCFDLVKYTFIVLVASCMSHHFLIIIISFLIMTAVSAVTSS